MAEIEKIEVRSMDIGEIERLIEIGPLRPSPPQRKEGRKMRLKVDLAATSAATSSAPARGRLIRQTSEEPS